MAGVSSSHLAAVEDENQKIKLFEVQLRKTVFIDNLSPAVSIDVLKSALSQFGGIVSASLLFHELDVKKRTTASLAEMETREQAENVVGEFEEKLFMLGGLPRPVRASFASREQFPERPIKKRRIKPKLVEHDSKEGRLALKRQKLAQRHSAEFDALEKIHQEERVALGTSQLEEFEVESEKLILIKKFEHHPAHRRIREKYEMGRP